MPWRQTQELPGICTIELQDGHRSTNRCPRLLICEHRRRGAGHSWALNIGAFAILVEIEMSWAGVESSIHFKRPGAKRNLCRWLHWRTS